MAQTRRTIAAGRSAPIFILWGVIWFVGYAQTQFFPDSARWSWIALDLVGIVGTIVLVRRSPAKTPHRGRAGLGWLVLFGYAVLWVNLLGPWEMIHRPEWAAYAPHMTRKITAYFATIPMFGYVLIGLWLDRFFIWLGAVVTLATLVGYYFVPDYFYLWLAVTGGGSLIAGGVIIRKFWR